MASKRLSRRGDEIQVGDLVSWPVPWGAINARVVEDRGNFGVGGRRMLQIRTLSEVEGAEVEFPVPEEELELME